VAIGHSAWVSEPSSAGRQRWSRRDLLLHTALFVGGVGVIALFFVAMGSAHQLNSSHSRLGVYTINDRQVGFRYFICSGEIVSYVELTVAHNNEAQRVWIANNPDAGAVVTGMTIPVDLEAGRDYEVVVQVGHRQAGQEFRPGNPPPAGQLLVRGKIRDEKQYEQNAAASCGKP
jgi:hypothetical protein